MMKLFKCCLAPPRPGSKSDHVAIDSVDEKLNRLTVTAYSSSKERIRDVARIIMQANDATSAVSIESFRNKWLQDLTREMLIINDNSNRLSSTGGSSSGNSAAESRLYAFAMLFSIAGNDENKRAMCDAKWLMEATSSIIQAESAGSDLRIFAVGMLRELSMLPSNRIPMARSSWLLDSIERVISEEHPGSSVRTFAFAMCWNLALTDENKVLLFRRTRLMELAARMINMEETSGSEVRANVMGLLWVLAEARENKVDMLRTPTLMTACQYIIETEPAGAEIKQHAFGMLQNLAFAKENKAELFRSNWLMAVTKKVIREEAPGSPVKAKAFGMLWNLAISKRNQPEMFKMRWLMETIERTLQKERPGSNVKANAFGLLWNIAGAEENKLEMFQMKRLLELTERCIREERPGSEVRANALGMLCELAVAEDNKRDMLAMKSLMDCLRRVLEEEPRGIGAESRACAFGLLWNLALSRSNQVLMFEMDWLMVHTERVLRDEPMGSEAKANAFAMLWNLAVADENKPRLFARRWVLDLAILAVKSFAPGKSEDVCANAFGLLQNLAATKQNQIEMFKSAELVSGTERVLTLLLLAPASSSASSASNLAALTSLGVGLPPLPTTPRSGSGRYTPMGSFSSSSALIMSQNEVILNCLGLLQNLAFADENKVAMCALDWIIATAHRIIQEAPAGAEVKANAFGMLWNLASLRDNQSEMLSGDRFRWLLPLTERCLREELIGSSVKTYALGMLKELSSNREHQLRFRRLSWIPEVAERVIRDEPIGSESKINVLAMLDELTSSSSSPESTSSSISLFSFEANSKTDELLTLTEQVLREETTQSQVKLVAFQWITSMLRGAGEDGTEILSKHGSVLVSALRCLQGEDKLPSGLQAALDSLLFQVARKESSRRLLLTHHPSALRAVHKRLMHVHPESSLLVLALGLLALDSTSLNPNANANNTSGVTNSEESDEDARQLSHGIRISSSHGMNQLLLAVETVAPVAAAPGEEDQESKTTNEDSRLCPAGFDLRDVVGAMLGLCRDPANCVSLARKLPVATVERVVLAAQSDPQLAEVMRLLYRLVKRLVAGRSALNVVEQKEEEPRRSNDDSEATREDAVKVGFERLLQSLVEFSSARDRQPQPLIQKSTTSISPESINGASSSSVSSSLDTQTSLPISSGKASMSVKFRQSARSSNPLGSAEALAFTGPGASSSSASSHLSEAITMKASSAPSTPPLLNPELLPPLNGNPSNKPAAEDDK